MPYCLLQHQSRLRAVIDALEVPVSFTVLPTTTVSMFLICTYGHLPSVSKFANARSHCLPGSVAASPHAVQDSTALASPMIKFKTVLFPYRSHMINYNTRQHTRTKTISRSGTTSTATKKRNNGYGFVSTGLNVFLLVCE